MVLVSTLPPTSQLPSIRIMQAQSISTLTDAVRYLRKIYNPEIRGTHRLRRLSRTVTGTKTGILQDHDATGPINLAQGDLVGLTTNNELAAFRNDEFERAYSLRWLTALIAHLSSHRENDGVEHDTANGLSDSSNLIEDAASLLAVCSGTAGAGLLTRELFIPISSNNGFLMRSRVKGDDESGGDSSTDEARNRSGGGGDNPDPITIRLQDIPLDNSDYGSLGAQTWGGAHVLSELIVEDPIKFGFGGSWCRSEPAIDDVQSSFQPESSKEALAFSLHSNGKILPEFRILELGAGTGLVSIAIGKLLERFCQMEVQRQEIRIPDGFMIIATDYYPAVLENLGSNIQMNFPSEGSSPVKVVHHPLDWSAFSSQIEGEDSEPMGPLGHPFDVVFGADIIYEVQHAIWIKKCLETLLRKPDPKHTGTREQGELVNDRGECCGPQNDFTDTSFTPASHTGEPTFHLVIPLRPTHQDESLSVEDVFPFGHFYLSQAASLTGANHHSLLDTLSTQALSLSSAHSKPSLNLTSNSSIESKHSLGYSRNAQSGLELVIFEKNILFCDAEERSSGHRAVEEVEYAHYKIGWGVRR